MQAAGATYVKAGQQNRMKAGEIKQSSCFHWPVLLAAHISKSVPYLSSTPRNRGKSSNGWQLTSSTGNHPSRGSHATAPLPATDHGGKPLQRSDVRLDGEYRSAAGHGRTGSRPVLEACCFSLLAGKNKPKTYNFFFRWCLVVSPGRSPPQPLPGLWLSPKRREWLDEWVCSFQGSVRYKKEPLTLFAVGERFSIPKTYFSENF